MVVASRPNPAYETRLLDRIKTKEISSFSFDIRREIKQVLEFGNEASVSVQD